MSICADLHDDDDDDDDGGGGGGGGSGGGLFHMSAKSWINTKYKFLEGQGQRSRSVGEVCAVLSPSSFPLRCYR